MSGVAARCYAAKLCKYTRFGDNYKSIVEAARAKNATDKNYRWNGPTGDGVSGMLRMEKKTIKAYFGPMVYAGAW